MNIRLVVILFSLLLLPAIGSAGDVTVPKCDGSSDQAQINTAIENADPGDTVYLDGLYIIDGTIWLKPGIALKGSPGTVVQVDSASTWWFREGIPVIGCKEIPKNIEISGFTLDGNNGAFSSSWANDGAGKSHNCEKLIIFAGSSDNPGENIIIDGMTFINAFSDAVYVRYANNVQCSNNFISNCQHEGIFYSVVTNGIISNNKIAGITSDCARLDNCQTCLIEYNYFYSFNGDSYGAFQNGNNGLQIGNAGSSKGYNAAKIGHDTKDITVRFNTFSDPGLKAIWLHPGTENVYIDDTNTFIDADSLITDGTPVNIASNGEPISYDNPPTQEQSEQVFDSLFDVFNLKFSETGHIKQGVITVIDPEWNHKGKYTDAYIYLAGYDGEIMMNGVLYIPDKPSKCAIIKTDTRNTARHSSGQTSSLTLTDTKDGSLKAALKVTTKYKVKDYKTVKVLGKSVKVPYYKNKKETVTFKKIFTAPAVFPVLSADDINVSITYQNNSYNPHATITVTAKDGNTDAITGVSYKYNGSTANEYRQIGYVTKDKNGFQSANFKETFTWKFSDESMSYSYQELYIKGVFDPANLHITVRTPFSEIVVNEYNYVEVGDPMKTKINPAPFVIVIVIFIIIRPLLQEFNYNFKRR